MSILFLFAGLGMLACTSTNSKLDKYDVVIKGGRVMDPESGLDAIRNVGIHMTERLLRSAMIH
jgi:hypothetical protein